MRHGDSFVPHWDSKRDSLPVSTCGGHWSWHGRHRSESTRQNDSHSWPRIILAQTVLGFFFQCVLAQNKRAVHVCVLRSYFCFVVPLAGAEMSFPGTISSANVSL